MNVLQQFNNDLICVKLYETRMQDRLKILRDTFLNNLKIPAFDVPTWLVDNDFIETIEDNNERPVITLNDLGIEYLKILETAEGKSGSMYFNTTEEEKNMEGPMKGHPTFDECSLYEDLTHSTPTSKLGEYLNPDNQPVCGKWVQSYDGRSYNRV